MAKVTLKEDETLDQLIKRFRKQCMNEGLWNEYKKRMYYTKPSAERRIIPRQNIKKKVK